MKWVIDSTLDLITIIAIAVLALSTILAAVLIVTKWTKRLKVGSVELDAEGSTPAGEVADRRLCPDLAEHAAAFDRIEALLQRLVDRTNDSDQAVGALISAQGIVLKFVRREIGRERDDSDKINGDLDEADIDLRRASKVYREGRKIEA